MEGAVKDVEWVERSNTLGQVVEFDWGVFFVDGGVWIVPANGGKGTDVDVSSGRGWLVSKEDMNGENTESDKENSEENQYGCRWVRHDDCLLKS